MFGGRDEEEGGEMEIWRIDTISIQGLSKANLWYRLCGVGGETPQLSVPAGGQICHANNAWDLGNQTISSFLSLLSLLSLSSSSPTKASVISKNLVGYFQPFVFHHILFHFPFSIFFTIVNTSYNPIALSLLEGFQVINAFHLRVSLEAERKEYILQAV